MDPRGQQPHVYRGSPAERVSGPFGPGLDRTGSQRRGRARRGHSEWGGGVRRASVPSPHVNGHGDAGGGLEPVRDPWQKLEGVAEAAHLGQLDQLRAVTTAELHVFVEQEVCRRRRSAKEKRTALDKRRAAPCGVDGLRCHDKNEVRVMGKC